MVRRASEKATGLLWLLTTCTYRPEGLKFVVPNELLLDHLRNRQSGGLGLKLKQRGGNRPSRLFRLSLQASIGLRGKELPQQNQREEGQQNQRDGEDAALKEGQLRPQTGEEAKAWHGK